MYLNYNFDNLYFLSDLHLGHKNIVRGVSNWEEKRGCRDYDTVEEMDKAIIDGINNVVQPEDILIIPGDLCIGYSRTRYIKYLDQINCKNIYLVKGNHDHGADRAKDLFKGVCDTLYLRYKDQLLVINHYPFRTWEDSHKGSINVHGHGHGTLDPVLVPGGYAKQIDVCVENSLKAFGEVQPFSIEFILEFLKDNKPTNNGHHTP